MSGLVKLDGSPQTEKQISVGRIPQTWKGGPQIARESSDWKQVLTLPGSFRVDGKFRLEGRFQTRRETLARRGLSHWKRVLRLERGLRRERVFRLEGMMKELQINLSCLYWQGPTKGLVGTNVAEAEP